MTVTCLHVHKQGDMCTINLTGSLPRGNKGGDVSGARRWRGERWRAEEGEQLPWQQQWRVREAVCSLSPHLAGEVEMSKNPKTINLLKFKKCSILVQFSVRLDQPLLTHCKGV